jgi:hypothetical protein
MSNKKTIAFCTNISDEYMHSMGAYNLQKSARYFHPDIPFYMYKTKDIEALNIPLPIAMPFVISKLMDEYEMVIRIDADSLIVGPLDEILNAKGYDVIGVRNNNDFGKAGVDDAIAQFNVGIFQYLNAGLVATTSREFVDEWMDANLSFGTMLPFGEQTVLNAIKRKYNTLIVDGLGTNVYYGVSGLYGSTTHWDSWKDILVEDTALKLRGKTIKVLHHAGGFKEHKLGLYMFSSQARERIEEIIQ